MWLSSLEGIENEIMEQPKVKSLLGILRMEELELFDRLYQAIHH